MPTQNDRLHNARYDTRAFFATHSFRFFCSFACFVLLFAFQPIYCKRAPCSIYTSFLFNEIEEEKSSETHNIGINISFGLFNKC